MFVFPSIKYMHTMHYFFQINAYSINTNKFVIKWMKPLYPIPHFAQEDEVANFQLKKDFGTKKSQ